MWWSKVSPQKVKQIKRCWKCGRRGSLQVYLGWSEKTPLMGWHLSETWRKGENSQRNLGRENRKYKGPGAATFLYLKNSKQAVWLEYRQQRGSVVWEDKVSEVAMSGHVGHCSCSKNLPFTLSGKWSHRRVFDREGTWLMLLKDRSGECNVENRRGGQVGAEDRN